MMSPQNPLDQVGAVTSSQGGQGCALLFAGIVVILLALAFGTRPGETSDPLDRIDSGIEVLSRSKEQAPASHRLRRHRVHTEQASDGN